jgi:acyl dehydratase
MDAGLHFEDLSVGRTFQTDGRTVTESDVFLFAGLTADYNYLHVDRHAAATGPFGAPVAHGMLVMSIGQGLFVSSRLLHGTSLGLAGFSEWKFTRPVFFGDTVHMQIEVSSARLTSRGDRGVCQFLLSLRNQEDDEVQTGIAVVLVASRGSGQSGTGDAVHK